MAISHYNFVRMNSKNFPDPFKKNVNIFREIVIEEDQKGRVNKFFLPFFPLVKTKKKINSTNGRDTISFSRRKKN